MRTKEDIKYITKKLAFVSVCLKFEKGDIKMNIGNFFGGRREGRDNCCCDIIWILFLLSICGGNGFGFGGHGDCDCMLIILLLLICNCGCNDNMGCRG